MSQAGIAKAFRHSAYLMDSERGKQSPRMGEGTELGLSQNQIRQRPRNSVSLPPAPPTPPAQSTWIGVRRMPALGERGSATLARCLLCGGGRAGVTGALLAEPISTGRKRVGQGPARGKKGMPVRSYSGLSPHRGQIRPRTPDHPSAQFPTEKPPGRWARGLCRNNWCS